MLTHLSKSLAFIRLNIYLPSQQLYASYLCSTLFDLSVKCTSITSPTPWKTVEGLNAINNVKQKKIDQRLKVPTP